ncbi:MAG: sulfatase-like hydrolase/transferase [Deltaproteobacteria bacterium]|nr:sulfatase-like hydrolase/transferase [Deltaproteobacteria bacterium]
MIRFLFSPSPWVVLVFISPTLAAVAFDLLLRIGPISQMRLYEYGNYFGSSLIASGVWFGWLWGMSLLPHRKSRVGRVIGRSLFGLLFVVIVLPILELAYGGQVLYYGVFRSYMARDTLRLGLIMHGTVGSWVAAWSWRVIPLGIVVAVACAALAWGVWKAGERVQRTWPILPLIATPLCVWLFWHDMVETRALQAASPDTCLLHSLVGLVRDGLLGGRGPHGVTVRQPRTLSELHPPEHKRNVILIITESVRGDVLCSDKAMAADDSQPKLPYALPSATSHCTSRFLDEALPERLGLARMTVQSPSTFSSCMMMWTGLPVDADMRTCHEAPFVWEVARAAGYKTAYVTSQNLRYQDFGAWVKISGADVLIAGADLGGVADPHIGAPDERATQKLVEWVQATSGPFFAVLHLSNTHWPYRTSPDLEPYSPHSRKPPSGDVEPYWNQYRNSVLMLERTVAQMYTALRTTAAWEDTLTLFVSDHGEQFYEHGQLYHINTLHEEEVHVPAFVAAGKNGLTVAEQGALAGNRGRRAYSQDLHATILDALGVLGDRPRMPFAERLTGRSLLRALGPSEPIMVASTTSGVWPDHDPVYGVISGERKLMGSDSLPWKCYLRDIDPGELHPVTPERCGILLKVASAHYPQVPMR